MIGSCVSSTMMSNEHTDVFDEPSVTVHVTVVVPKLKTTLFNVVPVPVVAPVNSYPTVIVVQLSVATTSQPVPVLV